MGLTLLSLTACSKTSDVITPMQGGISGILALEELQGGTQTSSRPAALLGMYVTDYLAAGPFAFVQSALSGITAQSAFAAEETSSDADYALLQAFADALNVELVSMLNQSVNREEALNKYVDALHNVAERAQTRYDGIVEQIKSLREVQRDQQREVSAAKTALNKAIKDEDFSQAGSIQETLDEKQTILSETQSQVTQMQSIERTFKKLLDIYEKRAIAIESNREALIAGITVINVPGAEELKIIEKPTKGNTSNGMQIPKFGEQ